MSMTREQLLQEQASARVFQESCDNALAPWGLRADAKPLSQSYNDYERSQLARVKRQLPDEHPLRSVKIWSLPSDALDVLKPQIFDAVSKSAFHRSSVAPGQIERREATDSNGHKVINWIGEESFVKQMGTPGRRARIRNPTDNPGWFPREVPSVWITGPK
jgi:hypothetical protein